jgi:hypothetical protein
MKRPRTENEAMDGGEPDNGSPPHHDDNAVERESQVDGIIDRLERLQESSRRRRPEPASPDG